MDIATNTLTGRAAAVDGPANENVDTAAGQLYDAECAFHDATLAHVDAWILAASDRLHAAIAAYSAAVAATSR